MQMKKDKLKNNVIRQLIYKKSLRFNVLLLLSLCTFTLLCSCQAIDFLTPDPLPTDEQISYNYYQTKLQKSTSADVLSTIHMPEHELLSQSKSVVASLGHNKHGHKVWFNMVAFDEDTMTAQRKYLFIEDEKPKYLFVEPRASARFDCQVVLEGEILDKPYSNENEKRIAIIRQVLENLHRDTDDVALDNKMIATALMTINQGFTSALVKLDASPAEAARLNNPNGLVFSNMSYDKGIIKYLLEGDIVTIEMNLGSITKKKIDLSDVLSTKEEPQQQ